MKTFCFGLLGLFFIFSFNTAQASTGRFLGVTDIHFDPFTTCESQDTVCPIVSDLIKADAAQWASIFEREGSTGLITYGADTNYGLFKSSLTELQNLDAQYRPDFILLIGDSLAHDFKEKYATYSGDNSPEGYQAFVKKVFIFLATQMQTALPNVSIYPVVGNNDSYNGDYYNEINGAFYQDLRSAWLPFFKEQRSKEWFLQNFPYAGYYKVPMKNNQGYILVLNTVLFSTKATGIGIEAAAEKQLTWLANRLADAKARKQHVFLVFHIPVGIDVYKTYTGPVHLTIPLWQADDTQKFLSLVNQYSSTITGMFTGHLHMDGFMLFSNQKNFDSFVPAISPSFGNNAAIKVFSYNRETMLVQDFMNYYLLTNNTNAQWQLLYDFNEKYQPNCTNCSLINGMKQLQEDNDLVSLYKLYYSSGNLTGQPINKDPLAWPYYWCDISYSLPNEFESCVSRGE